MMASAGQFIIKCKTENGSFIINNVNSESTIIELKLLLSRETNIGRECLKILCGYPPKALMDDCDGLKLKDVDIHSGDTIIIEKKQNIGATKPKEVRRPLTILAEAAAAEIRRSKEAANHVVSDQSTMYDPFSLSGIMMRHVVPSNNSCLFTSIQFILSSGDMNSENSLELREVIAQAVRSNPEKYTSVFLGMPNEDYCKWIKNVDHWGGAIELSILSEHYGIEIVAVDTISLKLHRFGENLNYSSRIFLIYDGIHYDPLVLEMDNAPMQTIFPVNDERPMEMALEIAREAKSSRQFTDVANFTLQCTICKEKLIGDKEATEHAKKTGHVNFGEITK